jgi:hypothetical protein
MNPIHPYPGDAQRPCFTILYRSVRYHDWQSDFGPAAIQTEDGRTYTALVSVGRDRNGEEILRLYLRPPLAKTPITPGKLELVR